MDHVFSEIIRLRLCNHQINQHTFKNPVQLASWMGAVQAQDYAAAKWSLGLRLPLATDKKIEDAFYDKSIVRTWLLRGTQHIVSGSDVWWLLDLLGPVVIARNAARFRKLELDNASFKKINGAILKLLKGGKQLTRKELFSGLNEQKISTDGDRGAHILYKAALEKLICLGSPAGKQETYTLLDEWLPAQATIDRKQALGELAVRYFQSHAPATLQDFTWWSGLSAAEAKTGYEIIKKSLFQETIEDKTYLFFQSSSNVEKMGSAVLLQGYDEYFLGYKDRNVMLDPKNKKLVEPGNGFSPVIIIDGLVKGTWKRSIKKDKLNIETKSFYPLNSSQKNAVALACEEYSQFLKLSL